MEEEERGEGVVSFIRRIFLDIDMPNSCAECPYKNQLDESGIWFCDRLATDDSDTDVSANGKPFDFRPDYCPLQEE